MAHGLLLKQPLPHWYWRIFRGQCVDRAQRGSPHMRLSYPPQPPVLHLYITEQIRNGWQRQWACAATRTGRLDGRVPSSSRARLAVTAVPVPSSLPRLPRPVLPAVSRPAAFPPVPARTPPPEDEDVAPLMTLGEGLAYCMSSSRSWHLMSTHTN